MVAHVGQVIFTGGNYFKVRELPKTNSDFVMVDGFRWIKAKKEFAAKSKLFPCPKNYQVLNEQEIENMKN